MRISLTPETAERIRGVLGDDVDLAPDLIPSVLSRLAVEAPAIYSQVLTEISGSQIRLDSEEELRKRRRRGLLRRLLFSWGEYETDVGDRLLAKRHIAAAVPLGIATLTMTLLFLTLLFGHRTASLDSRPFVVAQAPTRGRGALERPIALVVAKRSTPANQAAVAGGRAPWPGIRAPHASSVALLPMPPLPSLAEARGNLAGAPGNPIVVAPPVALPRDGAHGFASDGPVAPIVYNRFAAAAGPESTPAEATGRAPEASAAATDDSLTAGPNHHAWSPGARVPGRLVSGVVLVSGGPPVPVVAETETPRGVWLGQAALGPGDRVQLIMQLTGQDRTELVRALALDPERLTPGLTGRTSMRHPAVAAAVATVALQAAADYAQTVLQGGLGNFAGWMQFPGIQATPAWTYFASRLAQAVEPRTTAGTLLATTEIPAGTPLVLLITGAQ
jgi:hypothetical protein